MMRQERPEGGPGGWYMPAGFKMDFRVLKKIMLAMRFSILYTEG